MFTTNPIKDSCSQFITESKGIPTFKMLSDTYEDFSKVKIRHKKHETLASHSLDSAVDAKVYNRAMFTYGNNILTSNQTDKQMYYVFPSNGYSYLYSTSVVQSDLAIRTMFFDLFEKMAPNSSNQITNLVSDLLKFTYVDSNLCEGLSLGNEILFYNISCFYVVKQSSYVDYNELYSEITR